MAAIGIGEVELSQETIWRGKEMHSPTQVSPTAVPAISQHAPITFSIHLPADWSHHRSDKETRLR